MQRIIYALSVMVILASCNTGRRASISDIYSSKNKRVAVHATKKNGLARQTDKATENKTYTHDKNAGNNGASTRNAIINDAMAYVGVRYLPGGKKPETGFDCSGFTSFVFNRNNIPLHGPSDKQANLGTQKTKKDLVPGDLVFFGDKHRISHVAIVVRNDIEKLEVVHATTSAGVKKDEINLSKYWNQRFLFGSDIISGHLESNSSLTIKQP
jgi:probable lipoprotein NlpC